ncbi:MAG: prolipoprotein diacylglyceryl transferase family protein [bacterium]
MLNWLSYGVVEISKYLSPFIFAIAAGAWFFVLKNHIPIKKNYKALTKIAVVSCVGAGLSPLLIIVFSGRLLSFFSGSISTLKRVNDWNTFQALLATLLKGFSITGGLLLLTIILLFVMKNEKKLMFGILYPFPVFAATARLNCFLQGCCFGKMWDGPFAIKYPPASHASKFHYLKHGLVSRFEVSFPVHPVQLYISISMLVLFAVLVIMDKFKVPRNVTVGTMLIGYGMINFNIEFLRVESLLYNFLTMGQFMEIIIVALGFYVAFKVKESDIVLD